MPDGRLLVLHALTGLHPGAGTALGVVDLPVQRERHTLWPNIPGSSLKGVLRDASSRSERVRADDVFVTDAFGPPSNTAHDHAGALSFTDARILAFPVRSMRGVFAWVTCPAVLHRLGRDLSLLGMSGPAGPAAPEREEAACMERSPLLVGNGDRLLLEEFEFKRTGSADAVASWVAEHAFTDDAARQHVRERLVVLHDDDFSHFVRFATEVIARVGLDAPTKTVKRGALFYEEVLPPETLFYALVLAAPSRRPDSQRDAASLLRELEERVPPVVQIGADETIGRGLCAARFVSDAEGRS